VHGYQNIGDLALECWFYPEMTDTLLRVDNPQLRGETFPEEDLTQNTSKKPYYSLNNQIFRSRKLPETWALMTRKVSSALLLWI